MTGDYTTNLILIGLAFVPGLLMIVGHIYNRIKYR